MLNVTNAKLATGIDALKLADGSVNNSELQFIGTLTSDAQVQLNVLNAALTSAGTDTGSAIGESTAAIDALEKLAAGTIYLGDSSGDAQEVIMSGAVTISNAGITTIGADKVTTTEILDGTIATTDINPASATGTSNVVLSDSPTLTGVPLAPTADAANSTTQIATTEFVTAAVSSCKCFCSR